MGAHYTYISQRTDICAIGEKRSFAKDLETGMSKGVQLARDMLSTDGLVFEFKRPPLHIIVTT